VQWGRLARLADGARAAIGLSAGYGRARAARLASVWARARSARLRLGANVSRFPSAGWQGIATSPGNCSQTQFAGKILSGNWTSAMYVVTVKAAVDERRAVGGVG
jgi:hypothetical protein